MKDQEFKITHIQFFPHESKMQISEDEYEIVREYSANIFINDLFVVQVSGNDQEAHPLCIATGDECYVTTQEAQDYAYENYDKAEIEEQIELAGFENNSGWLEDNGERM